MVCRAEFRLLKDLYPPYANRINLLAIGVDPSEGPEVLQAYHAQQGYPWPAAVATRDMIEAYNVISTDIKYGIDQRGVIKFFRGYGASTRDAWAELLRTLAES